MVGFHVEGHELDLSTTKCGELLSKHIVAVMQSEEEEEVVVEEAEPKSAARDDEVMNPLQSEEQASSMVHDFQDTEPSHEEQATDQEVSSVMPPAAPDESQLQTDVLEHDTVQTPPQDPFDEVRLPKKLIDDTETVGGR